ncbi:MAG: flavodoxin-dependent (E)-4-hydroxy-3-methylbut-2-enyl-diphosphate synthase [Planctomycetota bacterium]|jgi:(E)-4-hydroxy-3-methylbut-2-enyl-diphosphate synthase
MSFKRRKSRVVSVGNVLVGGDNPVSVQTMTKADPYDSQLILKQVKASADLGCHIIRLAVPDLESLTAFAKVKKASPIPIVADIHFNEKLALAAIEAGADKVRINPGNMKDWAAIEEVVNAAKNKGIALRIGVNSGSVRAKKGDDNRPMEEAMADAALEYIERIEAMGFNNFVVSMKASSVSETIAANMAVADKMDYPLHLGVTAAGPRETALLKSAAGIGGLLGQGIGDTIRLSFTGSPESEVEAGFDLLRAVGLCEDRVEVLSCPTCGRCKVDLQEMVLKVRDRLAHLHTPVQVAVMGCEVNGPGEAKESDIGIAAGKGKYALFAGGKLIKTVPEDNALDELCAEVEKIAGR